MTFEFNEQQKKLIKEYRELIAFGYQKISKIALNFNKVRVRKRVLYFMMGGNVKLFGKYIETNGIRTCL